MLIHCGRMKPTIVVVNGERSGLPDEVRAELADCLKRRMS
jgi:hypothetical protein